MTQPTATQHHAPRMPGKLSESREPSKRLSRAAGPHADGQQQDLEEVAAVILSRKLDLKVRRLTCYGALTLALVLYLTGLCAVGVFLGLYPQIPAATSDTAHIVVATLVALFSVPTFLLWSVLRSSSGTAKDTGAESLHATLGQRLLGLIDKTLEKVTK